MPGIDETKQFVPLKIAVLTISDTRRLKDDKSGALLVQRIVAAGHYVAERSIVTDDIEAIRARVKAWIADPVIDVDHHHRRHRLHRPRRHAGGDRAAVRQEDGRLLGAVPGGQLPEDRHFGDPVARHRRRRRRDLYLLPAGLARRLQGRLGRDSGAPARLSLRAVQFRRDHAAARRASAPAEGPHATRLSGNGQPGLYFLTLNICKRRRTMAKIRIRSVRLLGRLRKLFLH